jgi:hypothetical protein
MVRSDLYAAAAGRDRAQEAFLLVGRTGVAQLPAVGIGGIHHVANAGVSVFAPTFSGGWSGKDFARTAFFAIEARFNRSSRRFRNWRCIACWHRIFGSPVPAGIVLCGRRLFRCHRVHHGSSAKSAGMLPRYGVCQSRTHLGQQRASARHSLLPRRPAARRSDSALAGVATMSWFVQYPVGIGGPYLIRGQYFDGKVWVPMATKEGALIAS